MSGSRPNDRDVTYEEAVELVFPGIASDPRTASPCCTAKPRAPASVSLAVFGRSPDLTRLRDEGYAATPLVSSAGTAHLLVADVPYVTTGRKLDRGTLVTPDGSEKSR